MSADEAARALGALQLGEAEAKVDSGADVLRERPLWGGAWRAAGAARCAVPAEWADVSVIREVPDHQEVFAEEAVGGSRSLIFDIVEAAELEDDHVAQHYMQDLFEVGRRIEIGDGRRGPPKTSEAADSAIFDVGGVAPTALSRAMPEGAILPSGVAAFGRMIVGKFHSTAEEAPDVVDVAMLVLRLAHVESDILVTLNLPRKLAPQEDPQKDNDDGAEEVKLTEAGASQRPGAATDESVLAATLENESVGHVFAPSLRSFPSLFAMLHSTDSTHAARSKNPCCGAGVVSNRGLGVVWTVNKLTKKQRSKEAKKQRSKEAKKSTGAKKTSKSYVLALPKGLANFERAFLLQSTNLPSLLTIQSSCSFKPASDSLSCGNPEGELFYVSRTLRKQDPSGNPGLPLDPVATHFSAAAALRHQAKQHARDLVAEHLALNDEVK
eukprot:scaffold537_cov241-Pinguiococcus_pyrenoidosus.AAC.11